MLARATERKPRRDRSNSIRSPRFRSARALAVLTALLSLFVPGARPALAAQRSAPTADAVIIGGGPFGLAAAIAARRNGAQHVVVLEKRPSEYSRDYPVGLMRATVENLAFLGLDVSNLEHVVPMRGAERFPLRAGASHDDVRDLDGGAIATAGIASIERGLRDAASALGGIEIRTGREATRLEQDGDGVTVVASDGSRTRARTALLADGAHSRSARALGVRKVNLGESYSLAIAVFEQPGADVFGYRDLPAPDGSAMRVFRTDAQKSSVSFRVPAGLDLRDRKMRAEVMHAIGASMGIRGAFAKEPDVVRIATKLANRVTVGRVMLGGDAVRQLDPEEGLGLNAALMDAMRFGSALGATVRGTSVETAVAAYDASTWDANDQLLSRVNRGQNTLRASALRRLGRMRRLPTVRAQLRARIGDGRANRLRSPAVRARILGAPPLPASRHSRLGVFR
jgi:2-polyprenyl-6-methoxyphenol hydroxylase-like FAD-dependent oxidoreductase